MKKFYTIRKDKSFANGLDIRSISGDKIAEYIHKFEHHNMLVCRYANDDKPIFIVQANCSEDAVDKFNDSIVFRVK